MYPLVCAGTVFFVEDNRRVVHLHAVDVTILMNENEKRLNVGRHSVSEGLGHRNGFWGSDSRHPAPQTVTKSILPLRSPPPFYPGQIRNLYLFNSLRLID